MTMFMCRQLVMSVTMQLSGWGGGGGGGSFSMFVVIISPDSACCNYILTYWVEFLCLQHQSLSNNAMRCKTILYVMRRIV